MRAGRQIIIERAVNEIKQSFMKDVLRGCQDKNEAIYAVASLMHDFMNMSFMVISKECTQQEAKAAYKVLMDQVLLDYGMSVAIHEFQ